MESIAAPLYHKTATTRVHKKLRLCYDSSWMKMNTEKIGIDKCRLCLVDGDRNCLTPIFGDSDDTGLSLAARIMVCLSIPVEARDSLPLSICKFCKHRVTQFYTFRKICYDSHYSLLERRAANDGHDFLEDAIEEDENSRSDLQKCKRVTKSETPEESQPYSDLRIHESTHLVTNTQSTEGDIAEETRSNEEEGPVENLQTNSLINKTISTNIELANVENKSPSPSGEKQNYEDKISSKEDASTDEEILDIKYKCFQCDGIFPDFDTASVHCAECLSFEEDEVNAPIEQEPVESLDETLKDRTENVDTEEDKNESSNPRTASLSIISINQRKTVVSHGNEDSKASRPKPSGNRKSKPKKSGHSCPDCDSVFSSPALLRRHLVVHTGERPFECPICKKRFSQVGQLNFHKNFHENPRYRCDVCKKPFLRPSDIEKHMRTHTGEKPYGCNVCSKSFAQLVALQQHERIHTGDKPYVCEICGKSFSQKANKTKHVKIHKEGAKPHTCEICGRSFSDLEEMNLHRAGHGGGKPRKCNYCEESFRKMSELAQHIRRYHTFERPHKCAFCQKAFYSMYNLKQHVMVHTGQKPYACSQCDLRFTQKGNLTKHVERKHGEKYGTVVESEEEQKEGILILVDNLEGDATDNYTCNNCNLTFSNKDKFQRHLDQHPDYALDRNKYVVIEGVEENEQEMMILSNGLVESTVEPAIIEREETVQVETGEDQDNLQIYNSNE